MFPRAGGDYVYLREAFHPAAGFLVGWLTFFAIYAGTVATLAAGFAESVARVPRAPGRRRRPAGGRDRRRVLGAQLRERAVGRAREQRDEVGEDRGPPRVRAPRPADGRRARGEPPAARHRPDRRRDAFRVRPRALAGALQLPRLERVGLRRERDPRPAAQHPALALPRPRDLRRALPALERASTCTRSRSTCCATRPTPAKGPRACSSATPGGGSSPPSCCSRSSAR